jgi:hypothetical protein
MNFELQWEIVVIEVASDVTRWFPCGQLLLRQRLKKALLQAAGHRPQRAALRLLVRHQAGHRGAASNDQDGLSTAHFLQQAGEMGPGLSDRHHAHVRNPQSALSSF